MKRVSVYCKSCFFVFFVVNAAVFFLSAGARAHYNPVAKATLLTKFQFSLTNRGIIILAARLSNYPDTLHFIFDTGCGGISLDSATVVRLGLTPAKSEAKIVGLSQNKDAQFILNEQLRLPGLQVANLDFHINDYEFLSDAYNFKIDGVIGYSFLKQYIVKLNYDSFEMEVWKPGIMEYPKGGYIIPAGSGKLASIDATLVDNRKIESHFYFDTGADMCFLLSDKFISDSNVLDNNKKILHAEGEGLGGRKAMRLTTVSEVQLGPYTIKNVPAYIFNDDYNVANYPTNGGVIGNELLQRFNVIINYPDNQIHLLPNSMFNQPFNYAYTGFSMSSINGKVLISNIAEGSPAQVAGLNNNDILFGINDNFGNDIDEYKSFFNKAGAKIKVFYLRDNRVKSTIVEVKSIL